MGNYKFKTKKLQFPAQDNESFPLHVRTKQQQKTEIVKIAYVHFFSSTPTVSSQPKKAPITWKPKETIYHGARTRFFTKKWPKFLKLKTKMRHKKQENADDIVEDGGTWSDRFRRVFAEIPRSKMSEFFRGSQVIPLFSGFSYIVSPAAAAAVVDKPLDLRSVMYRSRIRRRESESNRRERERDRILNSEFWNFLFSFVCWNREFFKPHKKIEKKDRPMVFIFLLKVNFYIIYVDFSCNYVRWVNIMY